MSSTDYSRIKKIESETLATFEEEIPSIYFSDKSEKDYLEFRANQESIYHDFFNFPPKMFEGTKLIDFGAGTGENTVYLANWGASCTLVEMNKSAQDISKEVFEKYSGDMASHRFVHSSIFDYEPVDDETYDIVHCRGVLSHTGAKEEAFKKIAGFVKPGGYLIFGDPNKAGGFQNMLQRFAVYECAKTPDEMVEVCELLFKEDIDRSQHFVPRTRRSIIFDRWVIQRQDDPSMAEIVEWVENCGMRLYSTYPATVMPLLGDSLHHRPRRDRYSAKELLAIPELIWMLQTESDEESISIVSETAKEFSRSFEDLTSYLAAFSLDSRLDADEFMRMSEDLQQSAVAMQPLDPIKEKLTEFLMEANDFIRLVRTSDLEALREFIVSTKHLFKGACGVRHMDIIAHKPTSS